MSQTGRTKSPPGPSASGPIERDDFTLMAAIAGGDTSALEELYDRHRGLVYSLGLRVLGNPSDAEELLIDVFAEVWTRANRYDASRGSPLTYLAMLARSRAIDRKRSMKSLRALPLDTSPQEAGTAAAGEGPAEQAAMSEWGGRVRAAMQSLEASQRQAIESSFFDGLSHAEIAAKTGKPLGTIKTYIRQGLIRLREFVRNP